ncbi:MAG: hypothetical protein PVJ16_07695 [Nitrosopumilaceae archaeon]
MNFLKDKVKKYQEKKLMESKEKLKFYTNCKTHLEKQLKLAKDEEITGIKKQIEKQDAFIKIWKNNITSITKQMKKIDC